MGMNEPQGAKSKNRSRQIYKQEEYLIARNVNIVDYLLASGYELKREGGNYAVVVHDSLKISVDGTKWNWFSNGIGGESPIDLISRLEGIDKPHAIRMLADYAKGNGQVAAAASEKKVTKAQAQTEVQKDFLLPEKNSTHKRAFAYLEQTRGIDKEIIDHYMKQGLIYEDKKYHNVVFVGQKTPQGEPKYASMRGTYTKAEKPFKGDAAGSDKSYAFAIEGSGDKVIVYESAVDALSHATIEKLEGKDWRLNHRVTLGGMSDKSLERYLGSHLDLKNITFFLDNDIGGRDDKGNTRNHGQVRAAALIKKYHDMGFSIENKLAETKDVNEDLKKMLGKKNIEGKWQSTMSNSSRRDDLMDTLQAGVKDVFTSEKYLNYLKVMSKFHTYSVNNNLLIAMQNPQATRVAGYTAWQKLFGRTVLPGAVAILIVAPTKYKTKNKVEKIDKETGKLVTVIETKENKGYKKVSVFDISQTEGKELPELVSELAGTAENAPKLLESMIKAMEKNIHISFEEIAGEAKGYFSEAKNKIVVKEGMSELQTIKTLVHEYAHSKLHAATNPGDNQIRGRAEVEAESVAFAVCEHFGIDTSEYSFPYITAWSKDKELEELRESLHVIRNESTKIIEEVEKQYQVIKDKTLDNENFSNKIIISREVAKDIFSKDIAVYFAEGENKNTLVTSKTQIEKSSGKFAISSEDLDKHKDKIPEVYDRYLATLFKMGFEKNPQETLKLFGQNVKENGLNEIILRNYNKDETLKGRLENAVNVGQCIAVVNERLSEFNNRKSNVIISLKSEKGGVMQSNILSVKEAEGTIKKLEKTYGNKAAEVYKSKLTIYTNKKGVWHSTDMRYDLGNEEKSLLDCIEKNCDKEVFKSCKVEFDKSKNIEVKLKNSDEREAK